MSSLFEYYRLTTTDENGNSCYKFTLVKEEDITIKGYTIQEIINILNALDVERIYDIKMTMSNLAVLYETLIKEQDKYREEAIKNMINDILKGSDKE